MDDDLIAAAGDAAGVPDALARSQDQSHDTQVRASFDEIRSLVGDEVGSPAIRHDAIGAAVSGPIVNPAPKGDDGARLLDAVVTVLETPAFYELKRTRTSGPDFS